MINEEKLLTDLGLAVYDELLKAHGLNLVETVKASKSMSITYNDSSRILNFSFGVQETEGVVINDDGQGNVVFTLPSSFVTTDDGEGNITTSGVTINDDGNGNVYII